MEIISTTTRFEGITLEYLASLDSNELDYLLENITTGNIDVETFLRPMIVQTDSMDENEKQYWFDILPSMNINQITRLMGILITEHLNLMELEKKYIKEIKALNEKHLKEFEQKKTSNK